jgi:hypothetical protein
MSEAGRPTFLGVVGNCQAGLLAEALKVLAGDRYEAVFFHSFDAEPTGRAARELENCHTLLVQDIQECLDYLDRSPLPGHIRRIDFPCLRFSSCWPFDDFNGWRDTVARASEKPDHDRYYDGALGRLRKQGLAADQRLDAYRHLSIKGLIDPLRLHDFEVRRLEAQDRRFGCSIGASVLSAFRKEQVFYAVTRPNGRLLKRVLDYLLDRLDLAGSVIAAAELDGLRNVQIPVHPEVAKRLGLAWANEETCYDTGGGWRQTWEGYVRDYIGRYG